MNTEQRESVLQGWQNETIKGPNLVEFLQTNIRGKYDSLSELHFSGNNPEIMRGIYEGSVTPTKVEALYESGTPTQIHAVFESENGQNIDVYLTGQALEDYQKQL